MTVKFDPNNEIIKLCIMGMALEENGELEKARKIFADAYKKATDDFEQFIAAYHLARLQINPSDQLKWMTISLEKAQKVDSQNVQSAYSNLYSKIGSLYEELGDLKKAEENFKVAKKFQDFISDEGPFYHGTKAELNVGDLLTAGGLSNYKDDLVMNHIYFTANHNNAGLAAALAKGDGGEHVYNVEPTGSFENDPNVTDKKFPGNLTRSYRSTEPLRVLKEVPDWDKLSDEERREWQKKLSKNKGDILN